MPDAQYKKSEEHIAQRNVNDSVNESRKNTTFTSPYNLQQILYGKIDSVSDIVDGEQTYILELYYGINKHATGQYISGVRATDPADLVSEGSFVHITNFPPDPPRILSGSGGGVNALPDGWESRALINGGIA